MSKVQSSRSNRRYNPLHPKPPGTLTPGPGLIINFYDPHVEAKKRESRKALKQPLVEAIDKQPSSRASESLRGKKWLRKQTTDFQEFFWQQFVAPVGTSARSPNAWPPFQSRATTILNMNNWKEKLTASEVWSIIRADRPDIAGTWYAVVNAIDTEAVQPYAPLKRSRGKMSTTKTVRRVSPASSSYQTPGAGSSALATPAMTGTWSLTSTPFSGIAQELSCDLLNDYFASPAYETVPRVPERYTKPAVDPPNTSPELFYQQPVIYDHGYIVPTQGQEPYGFWDLPTSEPRPDPSPPSLEDAFGLYSSHSIQTSEPTGEFNEMKFIEMLDQQYPLVPHIAPIAENPCSNNELYPTTFEAQRNLCSGDQEPEFHSSEDFQLSSISWKLPDDSPGPVTSPEGLYFADNGHFDELNLDYVPVSEPALEYQTLTYDNSSWITR